MNVDVNVELFDVEVKRWLQYRVFDHVPEVWLPNIPKAVWQHGMPGLSRLTDMKERVLEPALYDWFTV